MMQKLKSYDDDQYHGVRKKIIANIANHCLLSIYLSIYIYTHIIVTFLETNINVENPP